MNVVTDHFVKGTTDVDSHSIRIVVVGVSNFKPADLDVASGDGKSLRHHGPLCLEPDQVAGCTGSRHLNTFIVRARIHDDRPTGRQGIGGFLYGFPRGS